MTSRPRWFIPVCVLALLWNLLGLATIVADARLSASDIAALPDAQRALYAARPGWSIVASLVAVVCGTLGSAAFLMRPLAPTLPVPFPAFAIATSCRAAAGRSRRWLARLKEAP